MDYPLEDLVAHFQLQPHPEGGYFRETYRSETTLPAEQLSGDHSGPRNLSTCIYFLLTAGNFSAFHRIQQDEGWHFYHGAPLLLHIITPEGHYQKHHIGTDFRAGQVPQYVVPGGCWFAAEVTTARAYSFIGCTVAPGFHFDDFELARRQELQAAFPQHQALIERLTRV
ncbi:MAG: cupin domain-containing protein [Schleiferiaceae bacterium]|nr:cupin domain-containing protein [Schleiferiaceae bacterium]